MKRNLLSQWLLQGQWHSHRLQMSMVMIAIALGIALGFSIQLINSAAIHEFSSAIKILSGQSDLQIRAVQPTFDEMLYPKLAQREGVELASPVLEIQAAIPGQSDDTRNGMLKILGIDVFRAMAMTPDIVAVPAEDRNFDTLAIDAIFLSPAAMEWLKVAQGDSLSLRLGTKTVTLRVAGGLVRTNPGQRLAVMDIGAAQWHCEHIGLLSRVDLKLKQSVNLAQFKAALEKELPSQYLVAETIDQEKRINNMSRAYRINLNVLALVALFTGIFLVFATQFLATLQRRPQLALLRVLGMTKKQILLQILKESSLLGLLGALLGIVLGYGFAISALYFLGGDLGAGFFPDIQPQIQFDPWLTLLFLMLGIGVTLMGSITPAWEAANAHPAQALKSGSEALSMTRLNKPWAATTCIIIALIFTQLPPVAELPLFGYFAVALLLIGGIAWMPTLAKLFFSLLLAFTNRYPRNVLTQLVLARLSNASHQAAIALGGVLASFSLMVAMAIMVASFRVSIEHWLDHILPADIYVRTELRQDVIGFTRSEQDALANTSGIERIDFIYSQQISLDSSRPSVTLFARPIDKNDPGGVLPLTDDVLPTETLANSDAIPIWVSEAMVDLYDFQVGKQIELPLGKTLHNYIVAGVWHDYGRQFGAIQMRLSDYQAVSGEFHINEAAIWLTDGVSTQQMMNTLRALPFGEALVFWQPNEIRSLSLKIFDRSFAVTYLLEIIAVLVGLLGVAASFSAQVLTRIKEFGILRHMGLTRSQIIRMLTLEGGFLTGFGITIGFILGGSISLILIFIVNPQSFHWTMQLYMPWSWLALMIIALLFSAALTAYIVGKSAVARQVVQSVKEDW
ncbi:MAG: ABC transporter permease [Nitrosomonas sp.]|nr:MAG: ABC transporter permease [Nitrosomonas sp.]